MSRSEKPMDSLVRGNDVGKAGIMFRHAAEPGEGPSSVSMIGARLRW
jgi:hypothetical protein